MFSSKKIIYFIIMSVLILCYINGIDYRVSVYGNDAQLPQSVIDFSDSAFTEMNEDSLVSIVTDEGNASSSHNSTSQENDGWGVADDPNATSDANTTDPTDQNGNVVDPNTTDPNVADPNGGADDPNQGGNENDPNGGADDPNGDADDPNGGHENPNGAQDTTTAATTTTRTTTRTTTTTTRTTTTRTTTTTTVNYTDTGNISFNTYEIKMYVGQSVSNSVKVPLGAQKRAYFTSKNPSIASVQTTGDTSVTITGLSVGTTWIQAMSPSGDLAYCKVTVLSFETEVLELTNVERRAYGLPDLVWGNNLVQNMAQIRLRESQELFSHTRPNGQSFYTVAGEIGLTYYTVGENLACGQVTPRQVVNEWMASPSHRANILNEKFEQLCVTYGIGPDGLPYWVQIFYTPKR